MAEDKLIGMSTYSDLNQDYFMVALHTAEKQNIDVQSDIYRRKIEIRISAKKMYSRQFAKIWVNGSAINSTDAQRNKNAENILEFTRCIRGNLEKGDSLVIDYSPTTGSALFINNIYIRGFAEASFFDLLLDVLVGDVPLSSTMKRELLSGSLKNIPTETKTRYDSLSPTEANIEKAQGWAEESRKEAAAQRNSMTPTPVATKKPAPQKTQKTKPIEAIEKNKATKKIQAQKEPATLPTVLTPVKITPITPSTANSITAKKTYQKQLSEKLEDLATYPIMVSNRPVKNSIKFTITLDRNGKLLSFRQFEKSRYAVLNNGAIKLIEKSSPFLSFPSTIHGDFIDHDVYFYLHWRYRR